MITTYERGKADGMADGKIEGKTEGYRESVLLLLAEKFGSLTPAIEQHVAKMASEQLRQLLKDLVKASSLEALHLEE